MAEQKDFSLIKLHLDKYDLEDVKSIINQTMQKESIPVGSQAVISIIRDYKKVRKQCADLALKLNNLEIEFEEVKIKQDNKISLLTDCIDSFKAFQHKLSQL